MAENDTVQAVEKVLGEPAFLELPENAWKIRTNLILASVISLAVVFGDLHIEADSQILGLKFKGLNDTVMTKSLIALVAYLLVHFLWVCADALLEWRLRLTGTRVAFVTTGMFSSEHADYPNDPRQSTLYNWWKYQAGQIGNFSSRIVDLDARLQHWEAEMKTKFVERADAMNIANATRSIAGIREQLVQLKRSVDSVGITISALRVPTSLARFDRWYELFLRSQNLRWLVIDFLAPLLAGAYALALLATR